MMKIEPWMKHPAVTVRPLDSAGHARAIMEEHRINQLPVVVNGALVGIVTDRDLRDAFPSVFASAGDARHRRRATPEADPDTIPVEDVMAREVLTLSPRDSMEEAARLMRRERIGSVPIVDRGHLVGIVTRSDVLDAFVEMVEGRAATG